ncbi:MAG: thioesterase family protein [Anaerolineae bacterium]|nr:thioesterase family protein [Anaerolineae bacterium]
MNEVPLFDNLRPGLQAEYSLVVEQEHTARHLGSGGVDVLATPEMVRMMERAAVMAVDHLLPDGYRTVGVRVDVTHKAPTPLGMTVTARAELIAVDGRRLTFRVTAADEREVVGEGIHERAIIALDRFARKIEEKRGLKGQ